MKGRLPIVLSCVALVVAVLGSTSVGQAAKNELARVPLLAKNADAVNGIKASKTPKAGELVPLNADKKFPASVVPAGSAGPAGPAGAKGDTGATGPAGPAGSLSGATAGGDLTGTYPDPTIADETIGNAQLEDGAVGTDQLQDGAVNTDEIADSAVDTDEIADGAVDSDEIQDGAVGTDQIADDAVTGAQVADGSLTLDDYTPMHGTVTVNVPIVAANACVVQPVSITGGQAGDLLLVEPPTGFPDNLVVTPMTTTGSSYTVNICNVSALASTASSDTWGYAVFR